jgi:hypothetical protein
VGAVGSAGPQLYCPAFRVVPSPGSRHLRLADLGIPHGELRRHLDPAAAARRGTQGLAQLLTLVELGELVQLLPESVSVRYPRPGVAYRPVPDAPPAVLAIAWPRQSRSQATAALVRAATSLEDDHRAP